MNYFWHVFNCTGEIGNLGGGLNLEQRNVEWQRNVEYNVEFGTTKCRIFQKFEIANIKITKDELFDNVIFELNFSFFWKLFEYLKYLIIFQIVRYWFSKW